MICCQVRRSSSVLIQVNCYITWFRCLILWVHMHVIQMTTLNLKFNLTDNAIYPTDDLAFNVNFMLHQVNVEHFWWAAQWMCGIVGWTYIQKFRQQGMNSYLRWRRHKEGQRRMPACCLLTSNDWCRVHLYASQFQTPSARLVDVARLQRYRVSGSITWISGAFAPKEQHCRPSTGSRVTQEHSTVCLIRVGQFNADNANDLWTMAELRTLFLL